MRSYRAILFLFLCLRLSAADPTGAIAGRVVDPSGSLIPGAKLTVESQTTGLRRESTSAADGGFIFPLLPPGTYNLTAESSAFRKYEQRGLVVPVNVTVSSVVTLQLGSLNESVQVEANALSSQRRSGVYRQPSET